MENKKRSGNSILRLVFVGISLLVQVGWVLLLALRLNEYSVYISLATSVISLLLVLRIFGRHSTSAMKIPWIMLMLAFPVMGLTLYLLIEICGDLGKTGRWLRRESLKNRPLLAKGGREIGELKQLDPDAANMATYLNRYGQGTLYTGSCVRYHGEGVQALADLKQDLEQAKQYIFMEYFIVEDQESFGEIREILVRKAREGVEVRLMYDDIGSIGYVNFQFARDLNRQGIQCRVFNPAVPILNLFMNHRDHRKMTIIDGKVAYTGGYNLANAYFDRERPFGKWKDTGLRIEGSAVRSFVVAYLEMWSASEGKEQDFLPYLKQVSACEGADCMVQPYFDNPLAEERVAENAYLNMISAAKKRVWFITPYLIITDEMTRALTLAAKRGVDVRIITPGIPDKKTVYGVTRSYYAQLVRDGVRIFEYTPGFCHAKMCLCDDNTASVGTSNLDYRSLYLHFENDVMLYGGRAVRDIEADFCSLFPQCHEVTEEYRQGRKAVLRIWQCILRLFAPLM